MRSMKLICWFNGQLDLETVNYQIYFYFLKTHYLYAQPYRYLLYEESPRGPGPFRRTCELICSRQPDLPAMHTRTRLLRHTSGSEVLPF